MPKLEYITTVFHGTTSNNIESLHSGINLNRGSKWADFGQGFYLTSSFIQALTWSRKRRDSFNEYRTTGLVDGVVLVYQLNVEYLMEMNGLLFNHQSLDWARFIHQNRSKTIDFTHDYDFVFGSVADGNTDELIKSLDSGIISISRFKQLIDSSKYGYNDQLSFHSNKALTYLSFIEVVKYDDEKATISGQKR